jgi:hypothetical protein
MPLSNAIPGSSLLSTNIINGCILSKYKCNINGASDTQPKIVPITHYKSTNNKINGGKWRKYGEIYAYILSILRIDVLKEKIL